MTPADHPTPAGPPPPAATPFDVCGPLPAGTVVLEASAGTGKTFTIAALAARYVAAGTPLEHILLVTFTRMATGELRERVRDRLVTAEQGLARALAGGTVPADDDVLRLLAAAPAGEVALRRRRLAGALSDFDAATIATTHGFCQHMLAGLGVAGDIEADAVFVDDATDLVDEVVADLYIRRFAPGRDEPPFDHDEARRIGRLAVGNALAPIEPRDAPEGSARAMRARLAGAVRTEVEARKRARGIITYDDLLTRLAAKLRDPQRGPAAAARLRERYRVALVDEFQDTDPVQWEILQRAFAGPSGRGSGETGPSGRGSGESGAGSPGDTTLVLIGDPKQAVYAFRGADVHAYLDAARHAGRRASLGVNWRSDQGLLDAFDAVWRDTRLGHDDIVYRSVRAAPSHREPRLAGAADPAPLRVRIVDREDPRIELTRKGFATAASAQRLVADDLAGDVVDLLAGKTELVDRAADGSETARTGVRPGHVAVLVRTHRQGALVRDALAAAGVPAVLGGAGQVGDEAYAVGHPLGYVGSLSSGVISGLNRSIKAESGRRMNGLIQFDAAVNPGNSGGPLLNRGGQVIGIVTSLANPSRDGYFIGIGFAVPIGTAGGAANAPQK